MHGIRIDRISEIGTNGSRCGLFRIGSAHQFTVTGNGILPFQDLDYNRT